MSKLIARVKVVLTAAPTWLTALATIVTIVAPIVAGQLPDYADVITRWGVTAAGWLTAAVLIIRRVTPVVENERGILPPS